MQLLPPPFRDDLGHRVPAAVVTKEVLRLVQADRKRREALPGLKAERERGGLRLGLLVGFLLAALLVLVDAWNVLPSVPREVMLIIGAAAVGLAARPLRPWLLACDQLRRPGQTRERFLDALLCASCAHDLKGTPARDDGCTVCPECGAAWRMDALPPPRRAPRAPR